MSLKDFRILAKLGEGTYSSVWLAKRLSDGQEYAIKKVKLQFLSEKERENSLNEVRLLASISNPYVIGFKEVFFEENQVLCLVMEYASGGDIYKKILQHQKDKTHFKEKDVWRYALQMIMGLKSLHDRKILHRDIKCANIFLSSDGKSAKLGDLNVSKVVKDFLAYTQTGTPYYASPEVWRDEPYDTKGDIWSLGCVLYEMCTLEPPFKGKGMPDLYRKVQKGLYEKLPSHYSNDLNALIGLCLQVSPSNRLSCAQLLQHPLIRKNCQGLLEDLEEDEPSNELLKTIKMPKNLDNLKPLKLTLPKANYKKQNSKTYSLNNMSPSPSSVAKGKSFIEKYGAVRPLHSREISRDYDAKKMPEKNLFENLDIETSKGRLQKKEPEGNANYQPRGAELAKMDIKHIIRGGKISESTSDVRRVRDFMEEEMRERRKAELRHEKPRPNLQQELLQNYHTPEEMGGRRMYMIRRQQSKEGSIDAGGDENRSGKIIAAIRNAHMANLEKESPAKMYEDRIEAIERKAQQVIRKYQMDLINSEDSSPIRNKRESRPVLERNKLVSDSLTLETHGSVSLSPQIKADQAYEVKPRIYKRYIERQGTEEIFIDSDQIKKILPEKSPIKSQKPVWWG